MGIEYHPEPGTILICDYHGFVPPEMIKRRPVVVISPRIRERPNLCTVVPLSTTEPPSIKAYHYKLCIEPRLPAPYEADYHWVKGDMFSTVCFSRLYMIFDGKDEQGKRKYVQTVLDEPDFLKIKQCVLHGLGMGALTDYL